VIGEVIRVARSLRTLSHCLGGNTVQLRPRAGQGPSLRGDSRLEEVSGGPLPLGSAERAPRTGLPFPGRVLSRVPCQGTLPAFEHTFDCPTAPRSSPSRSWP
jgi:hypothetical protein